MSDIIAGTETLLDADELRSKYPVAMAKVDSWFVSDQRLGSFMREQGVDLSDFTVLVPLVNTVIRYDPRKLYDVFDSMGCHVFVREHPNGDLKDEESPQFVYYNSIKRESKVAPSRLEAERKAFTDAFELLNN